MSSSSGFDIDLHAQARGSLVDEVDRLVGQEPVGDVAVRKGRRRDERGIGDADAVVLLVLLLEAAQDRHRILDRRLVDEDGLEAACEGCVLLDVLAILVEGRRADAMQLAAGECRLQEVRRIHGAVGLAGADERVHLVDEQDDAAFRRGDFLQHRLEALLELAAVFGARDERAHVEGEKLLVLQALRHVAVDDAQRQTLDDRGLADAGLADQDRVVLRTPRQDLDRAADLLVAADHRVELAVARRLGEVAGIFLQRVVGVLRRHVVGGAALAERIDRGVESLRGDARLGEDAAGLAILVESEAEQHPLDGDIAVARLLGHLLGGIEEAHQVARRLRLRGGSADLRLL